MNVKTMAVQHALGLIVDGVYGSKTIAAVKKFQSENGLAADGAAGAQTIAALMPAIEECDRRTLDRAVFFAAVRLSLFGSLNQGQVDGMNTLLDTVAHLPVNEQAYMLATAYHETGRAMQPVAERGPVSYFDKYETGRLGRLLGNTRQGDGYRYRGRGFVQITGRANYARCGGYIGTDLENDPDKALETDIACKLLLGGMTEGWFTGRKNTDYISTADADYINARRIINGTDRALAVAQIAMKFNTALRLAK